MLNIINLKPYKSILCLNGILPEVAFFQQLQLPIIAADGAANTLDSLGIAPDLILGDFDSVDEKILKRHKSLHYPDQNSSDYQKSLCYLKEHHLLPSIVVGINGGHLDHILNNINIFLESESVLYAPPIVGYVLKTNTREEFTLPLNTKISLFGIPSATISSMGLKWNLDQRQLNFPGSNSCFNRTQHPTVELTVHQGSVLVLIYMNPSMDAGGA